MAEARQLLPTGEFVETDELTAKLREASADFKPFDQRVKLFVADLARYLRREPSCRADPAIAALAFWIRTASIDRLEQSWVAKRRLDESVLFVRRGVVFHLPPTNVDTLFAYSWLLSALMGNSNVVRISPRAIDQGPLTLIEAIGSVLEDHAQVAATMSFLTYGHEQNITESLSQADVRVIWGGDESVRAIRAIPMNPLGSELAFADRFSMAAFDAVAVVKLSDRLLDELARKFFNDAYWFDQLGCSSPRVLFWRGEKADCVAAQERFLTSLVERIEAEGYETPVGATMAKLVKAATMAADGTTSSVGWSNPALTVVEQAADCELDRDMPGGGMFSLRHVSSLADVIKEVRQRDQTLSVFGFENAELEHLVEMANGAGLDRVVPVGSALEFDSHWDGWDLLSSFSRQVSVRSGQGAGMPK